MIPGAVWIDAPNLRKQRFLLQFGIKFAEYQSAALFVFHYPGVEAIPGLPERRQRSLQYRTESQLRSHFLRQLNGRPQTGQIFVGRSRFCSADARPERFMRNHLSKPHQRPDPQAIKYRIYMRKWRDA